MNRVATETAQKMQRVKVGAIGLVVVVLLIAIANALLGSASRERPVEAARTDVVGNAAVGNTATATEPLAELGVAPPADANGTAQPQ